MRKLLYKLAMTITVIGVLVGVSGCRNGRKEEILTQEGIAPSLQEEQQEGAASSMQEGENDEEKVAKILEPRGEVVENVGNHMVLIDYPTDEWEMDKDIEMIAIVDNYHEWECIGMTSYYEGLFNRFREGKYTEKYFEENSIAYYIFTDSAGMEYKFEKAERTTKDGKDVLTIYLTYSIENMRNTQSGYYVFGEFDKEFGEGIDEIILERIERK